MNRYYLMKRLMLRMLMRHLAISLKCHERALEEKDAYCTVLHSIRASAFQCLIDEVKEMQDDES